MNPIIELLKGKGALTAENVKKAYRALSKRAHPDSSGRDPALFVKLRERYLEAMRIAAEAPGEAPASRKQRYENDLSLILFGFELIDSRNWRRYYEMALYLLGEAEPSLARHYAALHGLFRKSTDRKTANLRRILSGEAAAVADSLYGDARLKRALFESYSRELSEAAPLFDPATRESIQAFQAWLESKLPGGRT